MGTWGTGISSNDDFMDVYGEIMDNFNKGISIKTVIQNIIKKYEDAFEDDENSLHNLYFAAAYAAWECGLYDNPLYQKVKEIIKSGSDIDCWRELGASEIDLKKREKVLLSFLEKLSIPKENPKKPKPIKYKPTLFEKGDVLSIQLDDGSYSGGVVLENIKSSEEFGSNFIVKAYMNSLEKPTVKEILSSKVYSYAWYISVQYRKYIKRIDKIGNVEIKYVYNSEGVGTTHSGWITLVSANNQNHYGVEENKDIKNINLFLDMTPSEIEKRQKDKVKSSIRKTLNKKK